jgi:hypothetical protein
VADVTDLVSVAVVAVAVGGATAALLYAIRDLGRHHDRDRRVYPPPWHSDASDPGD